MARTPDHDDILRDVLVVDEDDFDSDSDNDERFEAQSAHSNNGGQEAPKPTTIDSTQEQSQQQPQPVPAKRGAFDKRNIQISDSDSDSDDADRHEGSGTAVPPRRHPMQFTSPGNDTTVTTASASATASHNASMEEPGAPDDIPRFSPGRSARRDGDIGAAATTEDNAAPAKGIQELHDKELVDELSKRVEKYEAAKSSSGSSHDAGHHRQADNARQETTRQEAARRPKLQQTEATAAAASSHGKSSAGTTPQLPTSRKKATAHESTSNSTTTAGGSIKATESSSSAKKHQRQRPHQDAQQQEAKSESENAAAPFSAVEGKKTRFESKSALARLYNSHSKTQQKIENMRQIQQELEEETFKESCSFQPKITHRAAKTDRAPVLVPRCFSPATAQAEKAMLLHQCRKDVTVDVDLSQQQPQHHTHAQSTSVASGRPASTATPTGVSGQSPRPPLAPLHTSPGLQQSSTASSSQRACSSSTSTHGKRKERSVSPRMRESVATKKYHSSSASPTMRRPSSAGNRPLCSSRASAGSQPTATQQQQRRSEPHADASAAAAASTTDEKEKDKEEPRCYARLYEDTLQRENRRKAIEALDAEKRRGNTYGAVTRNSEDMEKILRRLATSGERKDAAVTELREEQERHLLHSTLRKPKEDVDRIVHRLTKPKSPPPEEKPQPKIMNQVSEMLAQSKRRTIYQRHFSGILSSNGTSDAQRDDDEASSPSPHVIKVEFAEKYEAECARAIRAALINSALVQYQHELLQQEKERPNTSGSSTPRIVTEESRRSVSPHAPSPPRNHQQQQQVDIQKRQEDLEKVIKEATFDGGQFYDALVLYERRFGPQPYSEKCESTAGRRYRTPSPPQRQQQQRGDERTTSVAASSDKKAPAATSVRSASPTAATTATSPLDVYNFPFKPHISEKSREIIAAIRPKVHPTPTYERLYRAQTAASSAVPKTAQEIEKETEAKREEAWESEQKKKPEEQLQGGSKKQREHNRSPSPSSRYRTNLAAANRKRTQNADENTAAPSTTPPRSPPRSAKKSKTPSSYAELERHRREHSQQLQHAKNKNDTSISGDSVISHVRDDEDDDAEQLLRDLEEAADFLQSSMHNTSTSSAHNTSELQHNTSTGTQTNNEEDVVEEGEEAGDANEVQEQDAAADESTAKKKADDTTVSSSALAAGRTPLDVVAANAARRSQAKATTAQKKRKPKHALPDSDEYSFGHPDACLTRKTSWTTEPKTTDILLETEECQLPGKFSHFTGGNIGNSNRGHCVISHGVLLHLDARKMQSERLKKLGRELARQQLSGVTFKAVKAKEW